MQGHRIILKTGKLLDFELACNALKEAGIPFVKQEENYTGLKEAYCQPVMGPGNFFNLIVPFPFETKATQVISELPIEITLEPELWHYGADDKSKKYWKIYALIVLGISAIGLVINLFDLIKKI
jgi:hypothetical protein